MQGSDWFEKPRPRPALLPDPPPFCPQTFSTDRPTYFTPTRFFNLSNPRPSNPLISSALKTQRTQRTQRTPLTIISNMAEKQAEAPAAGMLWGGRFTGSNVSGNKLRTLYTDLTVSQVRLILSCISTMPPSITTRLFTKKISLGRLLLPEPTQRPASSATTNFRPLSVVCFK